MSSLEHNQNTNYSTSIPRQLRSNIYSFDDHANLGSPHDRRNDRLFKITGYKIYDKTSGTETLLITISSASTLTYTISSLTWQEKHYLHHLICQHLRRIDHENHPYFRVFLNKIEVYCKLMQKLWCILMILVSIINKFALCFQPSSILYTDH